MAPHQPNSNDVSATEKQPNATSTDEQTTGKAEADINEKAASEQSSIPGWTRLRTMKMRVLKGKRGTTAAASNVTFNSNDAKANSTERKSNEELKVSQTNGSGDGPHGVGEVEALHEVRSDDELLGDNDQEASSRQQGTVGGLGDGTDEREEVERTATEGTVYKVYKRRWFGLVQLVLMNIIVSWDVSVLPGSASLKPQILD